MRPSLELQKFTIPPLDGGLPIKRWPRCILLFLWVKPQKTSPSNSIFPGKIKICLPMKPNSIGKMRKQPDSLNQEIVAVPIPQKKGEAILFNTDEHPRLSEVSVLASLKPAFKEGGSVTAGNSSGINDGAAVCILASEEMVKQLGLTPMARVAGIGAAGVDPSIMGIGPVPATQKALKNAGLTIQDLDVAELNEAFAAQVLASMRTLGIDRSIVNPNGGSIAIGHPLGASGTRISATLIHHMNRNKSLKYGLATMCIGVGQGCAIIYENL